jgi:glycosyltransferase involved in cell wall biosynthesis
MISVLLPTYNSATTLGAAIKSIVRQSFREFELLVLDDGSTDGTATVVEHFDDSRIRYHKLEHHGLSATLNSGMRLAQYDIIARMDADDLCVPWRFERQLSLLRSLPENFLISSWYGVFMNETLQYITKTPLQSSDIKKGLLLHSYISHPGLIFHKRTLLEKGGYQATAGIDAFEDYETWLNLKGQVEFQIIPEVLVFQRYRRESLSNNLHYKQRTMYRIQEPFYKDISSHFNITNAFEENYYRGWREYFYGDKRRARGYWRKLGYGIIKQPRVVLAWFVTYLPEDIFVAFKESRVRFRLQYLFQYFSKESQSVRKIFATLVEGGSK